MNEYYNMAILQSTLAMLLLWVFCVFILSLFPVVYNSPKLLLRQTSFIISFSLELLESLETIYPHSFKFSVFKGKDYQCCLFQMLINIRL